jgi:hypothetical protein
MITEILVSILILAGAIGLLMGFSILIFAKGTNLHKRIGKNYFYATLVLSMTGAIVGFSRWIPLSELNGLLVCYFVLTSLLAFQKEKPFTLRFEWILALFGGALVISYILFALKAENMPEGKLAGFGATAYFVFQQLRHLLWSPMPITYSSNFILCEQRLSGICGVCYFHCLWLLLPFFLGRQSYLQQACSNL